MTGVDDDVILPHLFKFLLPQNAAVGGPFPVARSKTLGNNILPFRKKFFSVFNVILLPVKFSALLAHCTVRLDLQRVIRNIQG